MKHRAVVEVLVALLLASGIAYAQTGQDKARKPDDRPRCTATVKGFNVIWPARPDGKCNIKDAPDPTKESYDTLVEGKRVHAAPCPPRCW